MNYHYIFSKYIGKFTYSYALDLNWSVSEINKTFLMKVYGTDENGNKINKLLGVFGMIELIGQEMLNKLLKKAFVRCFKDPYGKFVAKLRRGIKITFYLH